CGGDSGSVAGIVCWGGGGGSGLARTKEGGGGIPNRARKRSRTTRDERAPPPRITAPAPRGGAFWPARRGRVRPLGRAAGNVEEESQDGRGQAGVGWRGENLAHIELDGLQ